MKHAQTSIPLTTPMHYLTGMTALNIPDPESKGGDWHFHEAFYGRGELPPKIFMAGEGEEWNTNAVLSDFGIYECSEALRSSGLKIPKGQRVYAANHLRAIIDLLYDCIKSKSYPYHLEIEQWVYSQDEKKELMRVIQQIKPYLDEDEWTIVQDWLLSSNNF
jgi:hypothetical protein